MNVAEDIYEKINSLSDDKPTKEELTDDIFVNFSMHHALRGIEADPVNYTSEDLKERWLWDI